MDFILSPWPWYVAGPLIALVMVLLLIVGKNFGMSANLRTLCTACGADKTVDFFRFDWTAQKWNLVVLVGTIIGGFLASHFMSNTTQVALNPKTIKNLETLGFKNAGATYLPNELFALNAITDIKTLLILILGGILVGFGSRYAGGCTSGHAISGLSDLQLPSLIAVIGFFIGGLTMVYLIFPLIF